jgi:hypothetical protein
MIQPTLQGKWKSSRSCGPSQGCIEVARLSEGIVAVRDSHQAGASEPFLRFDLAAWERFITMIKSGSLC